MRDTLGALRSVVVVLAMCAAVASPAYAGDEDVAVASGGESTVTAPAPESTVGWVCEMDFNRVSGDRFRRQALFSVKDPSGRFLIRQNTITLTRGVYMNAARSVCGIFGDVCDSVRIGGNMIPRASYKRCN